VTYEHSICQHCDDAPCIASCNVGAIYKAEDGAVIIDPDKCAETRCAGACPYENVIYFNDALNIAQSARSAHTCLMRAGRNPAALTPAPPARSPSARKEDLKDLIAKANPSSRGLAHVKPRVYYIGLPKKFIAGALFDNESDACIGGPPSQRQEKETGERFQAVSDSYGDFWLKGLKDGIYTC